MDFFYLYGKHTYSAVPHMVDCLVVKTIAVTNATSLSSFTLKSNIHMVPKHKK